MNTEKNKMLTLQIDKNMYNYLEKIAESQSRSVSNIVRLIIKLYLESQNNE